MRATFTAFIRLLVGEVKFVQLVRAAWWMRPPPVTDERRLEPGQAGNASET